ncbi:ATP-binding protein [Streptomyces sp. AA1529]|uniref:ATP-binding protein n=1 Tax=Streptomyces sp. AA1529 TaxID=1203257 RepID=UPI0002E2BDB2|nr:ATP-binding protein [Streptomyces sp. AA1529]
MQIVPPIHPEQHALENLLAARGLTADWLNTSNGDPYSQPNIARYSIIEASKIVPFHYRAAQPSLPAVRNWVDTLASQALTAAAERGSHVASVLRGPSLLLLGVTGVGKTHEAYGALRDLAITGVLANWTVTTAADLYAALRPRHGVDSETEFRRYRDSRVLLVDDLGAAKPSEFTEDINFRLINHRYERHLPTLVTSNVRPRELRDRLGDRVASRLNEMCQRISMKGEDRRRGEAA